MPRPDKKPAPITPPPYYPALLDLRQKKCVVVGGGQVATRKTISLIKSGATVTVISPEVTPRLARLSGSGKIKHIKRTIRPSDLKGAFLAVAATDSPEVNAKVARHAPFLINVADAPHLSNFIVPSSVVRGPLIIAISTSGASPALARRIRQEMELSFPAEVGPSLLRLYQERLSVLSEVKDPVARRRTLKKIGKTQHNKRRKG